MRVEHAALALVSPDVAVDGLVADRELPRPPQVARDLLGAPLPAQQLLDEGEVLFAKAQVAARADLRPLVCSWALLGR